MKNKNYWKARMEALEDENYQRSAAYYKDVREQFRQASNAMQMDIELWYRRLAENNDISYAAAKRLLKKGELEEFHWTVEQYIAAAEKHGTESDWMKKLENASARRHISYLEAMKLQAQQHAELLFTEYENGVTDFLHNTFSEQYYRAAWEFSKGTGVGYNLSQLDTRRIDMLIKRPWAQDGKNFSDRIWSNKEKLVNALHTELSQCIIRGEAPREAIARLAKRMNVSKEQAGNLIMTEAAAISSAAQEECYKELGTERYEFIGTLDGLTCKVCQGMDGLVFRMSDFEVGATAPPIHPRCRCCTVPHFDDWNEFDIKVERAARDPETDKTVYVDGTLDYRKWKTGQKGIEFREGVATAFDSGIISSGAVSGALTDKNDPLYVKRDKHAYTYYEAIRNSKKCPIVKIISKNSGFSEPYISKVYDHVFINEYELYGGKKHFAPDYDMAESFRRLREGKDIQDHDIILLKHEHLEYGLMNKLELSYDDAHNLAQSRYNYKDALNKFKEKNNL